MRIVSTIEEFNHLVLTHYQKEFMLLCSPDMAFQILENYNFGNRNIRPKNVERIARQMKLGHWKCKRGTSPLKFDKHGKMFGGQHRLHAVIIAGIVIGFYVLLDLEPDLRDIEDDVSPHQNHDNDRNLKTDITAISKRLTGMKLSTDEERRFYAEYKDAIDAVRGMFGTQPGVRIADVMAEFVKAYEIVPLGKLKYIARVLTTGLPEGKNGDVVIIKLRDLLIKRETPPFTDEQGNLAYWRKVQSVIKTVNDNRNPRTLVDITKPIYNIDGDIFEIIRNK